MVQGVMTAYITQRFGWQALFKTLSAISIISSVCLIGPVIEERRLNTTGMKNNTRDDDDDELISDCGDKTAAVGIESCKKEIV